MMKRISKESEKRTDTRQKAKRAKATTSDRPGGGRKTRVLDTVVTTARVKVGWTIGLELTMMQVRDLMKRQNENLLGSCVIACRFLFRLHGDVFVLRDPGMIQWRIEIWQQNNGKDCE